MICFLRERQYFNGLGPEDLPGKQVATTTGSTSAIYLRQQNIQPLEFPRIEQAYDALLKGLADAVVFDSPVLLYYAAREGKAGPIPGGLRHTLAHKQQYSAKGGYSHCVGMGPQRPCR